MTDKKKKKSAAELVTIQTMVLRDKVLQRAIINNLG
jgi:hypothetical protein